MTKLPRQQECLHDSE